MRLTTLTVTCLALLLATNSSAEAQLFGTNTTQTANQQTVNGTENFLIQRDAGGFVGGAGATNFIGGSAGGAVNALGALGGGGRGGLGGFGGGFGGFGRGNQGFGQNQLNNNANQQKPIRVSLRLGFTYAGPPPAAVSRQFARRLRRLPNLPSAKSIKVEMDGRTAVLQGAVESERERDLIARLVLLEPGVSDVRNEMTLATDLELIPPPAASGTN